MAKGRKTGGRDFKKGKKGGPGRPKMDPLLKEAVKMSRTRFREILVQSAHLTRQEVINKLQAKDTPALELAVLAVLREAIVRGDPSRLEVILNRMIGRVPTHIFLDDEEDRPYDAESDDDILAAARGEE